jgi:hypothetical protein
MEPQSLLPQLDAQTLEVIKRVSAVMLLDAAPTFTPTYDGVKVIYPSGSDYYFAIYANGAWRSQKLGITAPTVPVLTVAATTVSVPGSIGSDTAGTWNTGLTTCNFVVGIMNFGSISTYQGFWAPGQENPSSIVTDGKGNSAIGFLGADTSLYFNTLSFSTPTLTYHYKNTGISAGTAYLWAIGTI